MAADTSRIWLHRFASREEAGAAIRTWVDWYNFQRPHQAPGMKTPPPWPNWHRSCADSGGSLHPPPEESREEDPVQRRKDGAGPSGGSPEWTFCLPIAAPDGRVKLWRQRRRKFQRQSPGQLSGLGGAEIVSGNCRGGPKREPAQWPWLPDSGQIPAARVIQLRKWGCTFCRKKQKRLCSWHSCRGAFLI